MSDKPQALVTGAGGLVGSEAVHLLIESGFQVFGVENNMREQFFGPEGSTAPTLAMLDTVYTEDFHPVEADVRRPGQLDALFASHMFDLIVHTAAQPSHDWAAKQPHVDFAVNALGTLNMLEAARRYAPESPFCHISTSKVYGDRPNYLPLIDEGTRLELPPRHQYWPGIDTSMSVDKCLHSLFGVSKLSGDLLVQEYGRYFNLPTVCFRPGCVTGPAHAGVELHGFLAYLMKCAATKRPYNVIGYNGKQVRCNIFARDLAKACLVFAASPRSGAVYNIGGGRESACSVLEAMQMSEEISGNKMQLSFVDEPRIGDHRWWISDNGEFMAHYPEWAPEWTVHEQLEMIFEGNRASWT